MTFLWTLNVVDAVGWEKADGVCTKDRKFVVFNFRCFCAEKKKNIKEYMKRILSRASLLLPELVRKTYADSERWHKMSPVLYLTFPLKPRGGARIWIHAGDPTHTSVRGRAWWNSGVSRWWRENRNTYNVFYFLTRKRVLIFFLQNI